MPCARDFGEVAVMILSGIVGIDRAIPFILAKSLLAIQIAKVLEPHIQIKD